MNPQRHDAADAVILAAGYEPTASSSTPMAIARAMVRA
jgi:hypothetical protein